jgi:hypothetical protein
VEKEIPVSTDKRGKKRKKGSDDTIKAEVSKD